MSGMIRKPVISIRNKGFAVVAVAIMIVGVLSIPVANGAAKYVTMSQREKDLRDIANELVRLQGRVKYLENCVKNLQVDNFSSFSRVIC
jgi:conjugal transfer/entry exclusion protein